MNLKTFRKIAKGVAIFCIGFNLIGTALMVDALYHGNYMMALALFAYVALSSLVEYVIVARIYNGKLLSGWQYDSNGNPIA